MHFISLLLPAIEHFHIIGYWIAFFAAMLETVLGVGWIIPGSTIVLFMGALAGRGYFDLGDLFWFAIIGAIIGDNINYYVGKKYGTKIIAKGFWFVKPHHIKKAEDFFNNHGAKSVFFGRFVPSIKEIIPLIAGTLNMKRAPFMVWNVLGAIGWSLAWILPGFFFAQSLDIAKTWLTRAGLFLTVLLAVFAIFYILKIVFIKKGRQFFSFLYSLWLSVKRAVTENPEVKKFAGKHKAFFRFTRRRLDRNEFYGLPLTLLSLTLIYALSLFGGIIEDIINSDIIVSADIRVANLLAIFRSAGLTKFFFWVTLLGKWQIIMIFTAAAVLILWLWKKRLYISPLLLSIAGSEIFTSIGKLVFHRVRPDIAVYPENYFSFPSGHATIAVAFYGFLTYFLIRNAKQWNIKINAFFAGFILIILIGFSRLYLGVHYASDVWGGYLAGAIWLIIAISLSEYFSYNKPANAAVGPVIKKHAATGGLIFISIGLYVIFALNYKIPASILPEEKQIIISDPAAIFSSDQLKYTETLLGNKQEPLSFIIIAENDQRLIELFQQAGWSLADSAGISDLVELAKDALWKRPYSKAPMTPDFWNAGVHDFGFEKAAESNNVRARHHARFWKTSYLTENGGIIYVGAASFDSSIKWGVTHRIDPGIDTEREFLYNDLQKTGMIANAEKRQLVDPKLGSNFSGDLFFTDGKMYLISAIK
ncbi:PA-phosphatase [Candidatus Falkowbacteria bacterium CG10_big_fil_rev_8_21_14_0_10_43_10]|uniref:PA-phosphatase n=1 Tax=Candidatus Falkowbacteria bacterium CG10_big_fil_rev_8_21_14_0_10_43_10 TaxID=1974567 RepID=A0A2H0V2U7_9BACT|nr:MAG: PA-phosphatase [Candidatus Falkowbacteria bacterium CG10_big_fil_rev_8_21_14_0_10_43_10]